MPVPDPRLGLFWGGLNSAEAPPTAGPQRGSRARRRWRPIRASPRGPARSGQARSPTPQRASENLGRKSGPTTGSPTRAPARAHGALRGLPLKAQDGPHQPSPARPSPAQPGPTATREGRQKAPGREGPTSDRRGHSLRVAAPGGPRGPRGPLGPRGRGGGREESTGGCWSTRPGSPHPGSLPGSAAATPPHTRRFNLRQVRQPPAPRRQRDNHANVAVLLELRPGHCDQITSLADVADAPEGKRYIKADARWRPTTDRNVSGDSSRSRGREGAQPAARPPDLVPGHSGCRLSVPGRRRASASGAPGRPAGTARPRQPKGHSKNASGWLPLERGGTPATRLPGRPRRTCAENSPHTPGGPRAPVRHGRPRAAQAAPALPGGLRHISAGREGGRETDGQTETTRESTPRTTTDGRAFFFFFLTFIYL